ncbi:MAG TPA: type II toxin-antitoxin system VapC family toxin [Ilumatobacteraceae bacterium]|nr:type II toxin-antitoxin system VapC family toxin [Ilumatobacteraceae bacterium]
MIRYLDTSVFAKTIVDEPDSDGVTTALDGYRGAGDELVSSAILTTELHRLGHRQGLAPDDVRAALDLIDLVQVTDALLIRAGSFPGRSLRSRDAIHIATALEVGADSFLTADRRQGDAAAAAGLEVVSTLS